MMVVEQYARNPRKLIVHMGLLPFISLVLVWLDRLDYEEEKK